MFETPFTVVGTIITNPVRLRFGDQELFKFRVASNSRRRGPSGNWEPGNSLYVTVNCWGNLATGVSASLGKGDGVVVVGHLYTSEYEDKDGARRSSVEVRATALGPDLSRCIARIEPLPRPGASRSDTSAPGPRGDDPAEPADGDDDPSDDLGDEQADELVEGQALPLSA